MARSILDQAHALQLQSMEDLGHIRELDRMLAGALMAEFSRVQLIVREDVGKSLVASGVTFWTPAQLSSRTSPE